MMVLGFGFGFGFGFGLLAPTGWLKLLTFLMVYPMMVTFKLTKVLEGGDSKAQLVAQLINFGIIPFVAFGLGQTFFPTQPYYAMGLLLAALLADLGHDHFVDRLCRRQPRRGGQDDGARPDPRLAGDAVLRSMVAGHFTQIYLLKKHGQKAFQSE